MESQGKPRIPTLTLEDYLNLEQMDVISPHVLRKIISMHGFIGLKVPKDDILDAVRSIELMDVQHSTVQNDGVSSHAFLSLDDVIKDLDALHWQECCITSIASINSITDFSSGVDESSLLPKRLKSKSKSSSSSPKRLKSDSNEDPEGCETQSNSLVKIKGNTSEANYKEQVDEIKRPKKYMSLNSICDAIQQSRPNRKSRPPARYAD